MENQKIKVINTILFVFLVILNTNCSKTNKYYNKEDIQLRETYIEDNKIVVIFNYPMETMYYCSGADYRYSIDSTIVSLKFVKNRIRTKSSPMLEAKKITNTADSLLLKKYGHFSTIIEIPYFKKYSN